MYKRQGRLGCEGTDDWEAALSRADVDVGDVCVPDSLHTGVVLAALAQKKHVLIEKPLADTLENAKILLDACEGYPYKTMVGHICRFDIRYERAYEAIRDGTLGEIIYISSKRNSPTLGAKRYARQCKLITHSGVQDVYKRQESASRHPSGKRLFEVCDLVIDDLCPFGDALLRLPHSGVGVAPGSTVLGAAIVNAIAARVAAA